MNVALEPRPEQSMHCVVGPTAATPWLVTQPYNGGFVRWRVQSGRGFSPPPSTQQLLGYLSLVVNGHDQAWLHGCANRAGEWERSFPIEGTSQEPRVCLPSCWPYFWLAEHTYVAPMVCYLLIPPERCTAHPQVAFATSLVPNAVRESLRRTWAYFIAQQRSPQHEDRLWQLLDQLWPHAEAIRAAIWQAQDWDDGLEEGEELRPIPQRQLPLQIAA